jgi:YrbI family 3-deoxy-D-manno-octulosonate 8-phosphate phosphatase
VSETPLVWAIIPARGGSKGIANKNLCRVQGRTLVWRTIEAARGTPRVNRVFVTTDNAAIASEARRAGAEVIDRPVTLAGDEASSEAALLHALDILAEREKCLPDILLFLQCTSPFTCRGDIDGVLDALLRDGADTAHTVTPSHGYLWRKESGGDATGINHDKRARLRRQEREPEFLETGAVYAMRVAGFRAAGHRFFGRTALYEMPRSRALEIDEPDDLAQARLLAPLVDPPLRSLTLPGPIGGVVFDFDGVMTDNRVRQARDGTESVTCSRADGMGIEMLRRRGLPMAVLSGEHNPVVAARCKKLDLPCVQGIDDKASELDRISRGWGVTPRQVVYLGNDLNDLDCVALAGLGVAVADAHPRLLAAADCILTHKGGHGAVRELAELILAGFEPVRA